MPNHNKKPKIDLTTREFNTIKSDLVEHAKRFYPETYKDFSRGSVGSFFLDTVAYIGDMLSFYIDYNANESFLETAAEAKNIVSLARQMGFNDSLRNTTFGKTFVYATIDASTTGLGPDTRFLPIVRRGSTLVSTDGVLFTLIKDIDFSDDSAQFVVATEDPGTGAPLTYAARMEGDVVSGIYKETTFTINEFKKFRKLQIPDTGVSEIVAVYDSDGNEYYEVESLSQDLVIREINSGTSNPVSMMKPFAVDRKFIVSYSSGRASIQFGSQPPSSMLDRSISAPSDILLDKSAKSYITDTGFDPSKIATSDSLGIGPANTTLTVIYRSSNSTTNNVQIGSLTEFNEPIVDFTNRNSLNFSKLQSVINSLESFNEEPIMGSNSSMTIDEVKMRAKGVFASQNRAVTKNDYEALIQNMPGKFGAIKRVNVIKDTTARKNKLIAYVASEDSNGFLTKPNSKIKENIKTWVNNYKMLSDSIDLIDAEIVNFGVDFAVMIDGSFNKQTVLLDCREQVANLYSEPFMISEVIRISDLYKTLSDVPGVLSVDKVEIVVKQGTNYSSSYVDIKALQTRDGNMILTPESVVFELKYPTLDVRGVSA